MPARIVSAFRRGPGGYSAADMPMTNVGRAVITTKISSKISHVPTILTTLRRRSAALRCHALPGAASSSRTTCDRNSQHGQGVERRQASGLVLRTIHRAELVTSWQNQILRRAQRADGAAGWVDITCLPRCRRCKLLHGTRSPPRYQALSLVKLSVLYAPTHRMSIRHPLRM